MEMWRRVFIEEHADGYAVKKADGRHDAMLNGLEVRDALVSKTYTASALSWA
jgi:hypothetical protein